MKLRYLTVLAAVFALSACNGGNGQSAEDSEQSAARAEESSEHAGDTIVIKMITDDKGNYFEPNDIVAKEHDVLRFELVSGVHNVNFQLPENANLGDLPGPSDLLQLPGQTHFIPITWEEGTYKFHCDPHALLGMVGTLTVK